jgi:hypothetical protein
VEEVLVEVVLVGVAILDVVDAQLQDMYLAWEETVDVLEMCQGIWDGIMKFGIIVQRMVRL